MKFGSWAEGHGNIDKRKDILDLGSNPSRNASGRWAELHLFVLLRLSPFFWVLHTLSMTAFFDQLLVMVEVKAPLARVKGYF
jgi:hypothetical protein